MGFLSNPKCGSTYIIIDALDECEERSRIAFMRKLKHFLDGARSEPVPKTRIKFVVTSRRSVSGSETVADHPADYGMFVDQKQDGYLKDLKTFIRQRVAELSRQRAFPPDLKASVEDGLLEQAAETFLWARMVLGELESTYMGTKRDFEAILRRIPPDLEQTYLDYVSRIPVKRRDEALRFLLLLLSSSRQLSMHELNVAFSIQEHHHTVDQVSSDLQVDKVQSIHTLLGPLVKLSGPRISLLHQPVEDFLLGEKHHDDEHPVLRDITPTSVNLRMATTCIRFLLLEDFSQDLPGLEATSVVGSPEDELQYFGLFNGPEAVAADTHGLLVQEYVFYQYAALYWMKHSAPVERTAPEDLIRSARWLMNMDDPHGDRW
jgi:hypothetical protein